MLSVVVLCVCVRSAKLKYVRIHIVSYQIVNPSILVSRVLQRWRTKWHRWE